jgi:hypothetical protein
VTGVEEMPEDQKAVAAEVVACLLPVMTPEDIETWFSTCLRRLGGARPCDLVLAGAGDRVLELARAVSESRQRPETDRRIA